MIDGWKTAIKHSSQNYSYGRRIFNHFLGVWRGGKGPVSQIQITCPLDFEIQQFSFSSSVLLISNCPEEVKETDVLGTRMTSLRLLYGEILYACAGVIDGFRRDALSLCNLME